MTPLLVSLVLSTLAAAAPPTETRVQIVRDAAGKPARAIVSRIDGKRMTHCDTYAALLEQEYACQGSGCGNYYYLETGTGSGSTETEACSEARTQACDASDWCTSYQFCSTLTDWLGVLAYEQGGNCIYYNYGTCGGGSCQ
jgi:hypothetical protein